MFDPIPRRTPPPGQRRWSPPPWDPDAIAADYLYAVTDAATRGSIDPQWLEWVKDSLWQDLVRAYGGVRATDAYRHAEARIDHLVASAPAPAAPPPSAAIPSTRAAFAEPPPDTSAPALNGRALRKSIVPTWLSLVGLSWVGLVWGSLISAPIGVGAFLAAGSAAGIFLVPLWATVFGFLSMNAARGSTMRSLGFERVPDGHDLQRRVAGLADRLNIPCPEVGVVQVHNAFAMGASVNAATVAIGQPLLDSMTRDQVDAVLGHELGHVVSGDMRRMMLMRTFQNSLTWYMWGQRGKQFARWVLTWASELYILSVSREREYWADAIGAALTSREAMIGALTVLHEGPALTSGEQTHARFMARGRVGSLSATHPPMEDRIAALRNGTYLRRLPTR